MGGVMTIAAFNTRDGSPGVDHWSARQWKWCWSGSRIKSHRRSSILSNSSSSIFSSVVREPMESADFHDLNTASRDPIPTMACWFVTSIDVCCCSLRLFVDGRSGRSGWCFGSIVFRFISETSECSCPLDQSRIANHLPSVQNKASIL